jgi:cystathionine gamma-synthase
MARRFVRCGGGSGQCPLITRLPNVGMWHCSRPICAATTSYWLPDKSTGSSRWQCSLRLRCHSRPHNHLLLSSCRPRPQFTSRFSSSIIDQAIPTGSRPLGAPLPRDEHACSVSLPTWASVVGYEEGDPAVTAALRCGYPRFVYHPYVVALMNLVVAECSNDHEQAQDCLVLASAEAAERCRLFLQQALESSSGSGLNDTAFVGYTRPGCQATPLPAAASTTGSRVRRVSLSRDNVQVHAVIFPAATVWGAEAKAYWQHTGELVSSRRAERALRAWNVFPQEQVTDCGSVHHPAHAVQHVESDNVQASSEPQVTCPAWKLRRRIAQWAGVPSHEHVFLTTSGMSSIFSCLRSARRYQMLERSSNTKNLGGTAIVYGFPYLDTLKMCSRAELSPDGVEFFGKGDDDDLKALETLLTSSNPRRYSMLVTEVPSNPLLRTPHLTRLRELADAHDFCLVVDDTIANFLNVDLLQSGLADAVCTSLTKLVSGRGDAMAGSVVTNPWTPKGQWMTQDLARTTDVHGGLDRADARAIYLNSTDFVARSHVINVTTERLAEWLHNHPDVQHVYYPKLSPTADLYEAVRRRRFATDSDDVQLHEGGFGGMFSMVLEAHMCQRTFYDALDVAKGPSLGTNFTLVCPYTLLAHYHELDFAMSYAVPPNLLRVAVGLEDFNVLQEKFAQALAVSRLYPKPGRPSEAGR